MALLKYKNADGSWEAFDTPGAVKYIEQTLTETEQAQARINIGSYITRESLFSGNAASFTFPADKAPIDYDLICCQFASSNGTPGGEFVFDPNLTSSMLVIYFADMGGTICRGFITGLNSSTKGATVSINNNASDIPRIMKASGYIFEKGA